MITWQPCTVKLSDLRPWADNPRMSTKKQAQMLLDSWTRFGQVQTIAIGPDNEVYDGHQRLSAPLTVHGNGYTVDARRCSRALSDEERRALVVTLHAGAVGSWNWDNLANWDAGELQQWGFDGDTLGSWKTDVAALGVMLGADGKIEVPRPAAQSVSTLPGECLIEIYCSRADADLFAETLKEWGGRDGVTINVS